MPSADDHRRDPGEPVNGRLLAKFADVGMVLWMLSWVLMVRLRPGALRDAAEFLPACVTTGRRLRANPAMPRRAKVALLIAIVWVLSPIDFIPEFLPIIGPLHDVVAVVLLLRYAAPRSRAACCSRHGPSRHVCSNTCSAQLLPAQGVAACTQPKPLHRRDRSVATGVRRRPEGRARGQLRLVRPGLRRWRVRRGPGR